MDVHKNAPLTPCGREAMVRRVVEGGQTPKAVSEAVGVCPRTVRKWVARFLAEGVAALEADRSSRPASPRCPTPPEIIARIEGLRRQRWTCAQIASETRVSKATVVLCILRRLGLNRLKALEPAEPVRRYEREHPGELIHIDIKKLGKIGPIGHRITGRQTGSRQPPPGYRLGVRSCLHRRRLSCCLQSRHDGREQGKRRRSSSQAAVAYYASLGVKVERVMTDNGSCYRSRAFGRACKRLGLRHIFTKPYTPKPTARPSASSRPVSRGMGLCPRL